MLEDVVDGGFPDFWFITDYLNIGGQAVTMSFIFAAIGTVLLSRVTAALGNLSVPLNFLALFAGAVLANYFLADVWMPFDPKYQKPFILSLGGMTVAALVVMIFMKTEQPKAN